MKLIIVRHGETIENQLGICQGQTDGTLSSIGLCQIQSVAECLKDERIDVFFSSDLKRAVDSSVEIHKYHSQTPLIADKRIRERYFGEFQGKKFPENKKEQVLRDDAENNENLYLRVLNFYNELTTNYYDQTVLIVSHGVTIRMLFSVIHNLLPFSINSFEELKNGSISIVELSKNVSPKTLSYNSIDHIKR